MADSMSMGNDLPPVREGCPSGKGSLTDGRLSATSSSSPPSNTGLDTLQIGTGDTEIVSPLNDISGGEDWLGVTLCVEFAQDSDADAGLPFSALARTLDQAQAASIDRTRSKGNYVSVGAADEVRFGDTVFVVTSGGARLGGRGGLIMRWRLLSEHGLTILIANVPQPRGNAPNVCIHASSESLMRFGLSEVWRLMQHYVASFGGIIKRHVISRVDACVDFVGLDVDELCRVCNSDWHITTAKEGPNLYKRGARFSGFSVGKTPLLLRAYDKLLESRRDPVRYSLMVSHRWQCEPECATRVEYQFNRDWLKRYRVDTVDDWIERRATFLSLHTQHWFRLTDGPVDRRHTERSVMHPLWSKVCAAFLDVYGSPTDVSLEPRPKQPINVSTQVKQVLGVLIGIFARTEKIVVDNDQFWREVRFALQDVIGDRSMCAEIRRKMLLLGVTVPSEMDEACSEIPF